MRNKLVLALKIGISIGALLSISRQLQVKEIIDLLHHANFLYLVIATGLSLLAVPIVGWSDSEAASSLPLIRYSLTLLKMLIAFWFNKNILRRPIHKLFPADPMPSHRQFLLLEPPALERIEEKYTSNVG